MKPIRISRRTVLRSLGLGGAAIALPLLDAMQDGRGRWYTSAEAASIAPPLRFVLFHISNGVSATSLAPWTPSGTGAGYSLSPALQPLGALRDKINVLTGLRHTAYFLSPGGNMHAQATASLLAGVGTTPESAQATTLDQLIANAWMNDPATRTAIPSLQAICDPSGPPVKDNQPPIVTSWAARLQPLRPIEDPASYFKRLFGSFSSTPTPSGTPVDNTNSKREALYRKSVLDYVRGDIDSLKVVLGAEDRRRLDLHLSVIREIENQISVLDGTSPVPTSTPTVSCQQPNASDFNAATGEARINLMVKLTALALQCNLTRVAVLQYGWPFGNARFPWIGVNAGDHDLSHGDDAGYLPGVKYKVQTFASLVQLLNDASEGNGTVLDNSIVLGTSDVGLGSHNTDQHGVLLAGTAGGQIKTGMHQIFSSGTPLNQLLLSILQLLKVPGATKFGTDGTSPLSLA